MIPAGYMAKRIVLKPDWLEAGGIDDIYSISGHISEDFADYINFWKHNGYWLFNTPEIIDSVAEENSIDISDIDFFYYEVYEFEYDANTSGWRSFAPDASFNTEISKPKDMKLVGYDVVTFSCGTSPECSPLSCNGLATSIKSNRHCLLDSFEDAKALTEKNAFNAEPGPYRIFAVYTIKR
jgi:hypothetical protein